MTTTSRCAALLALLLPLAAAANGGSSGVVERTDGAVAGGDGGPLGATRIVPEDDVECASEDLAIALRPEAVDVQVDYVFVNHGATKTIDYAFPFALGEQDAFSDGTLTRTKRFGEPLAYAIAVDGRPVPWTARKGDPVPPAIPVPNIQDNENAPDGGWDPEWIPDPDAPPAPVLTTRARYRWDYRVSRLEFPAGKARKVRVAYTVPYLVYRKQGDLGSATSTGEFSYLLSTGGGWRGRTIGALRIRVTSASTPIAQLRVEGLPFARQRDGWVFEARDFAPTVEKNLVVRRLDLADVFVARRDEGQRTGIVDWTSPPVGGAAPATLELEVAEAEPGLGKPRDSGRYRLGLHPEPGFAQPARVRVRLGFESGADDVFNATFKPAAGADVAAEGGWRSIWFDAATRPSTLALTVTDVVPGPGGERRVRFVVRLESDVSDYEAYVVRPR